MENVEKEIERVKASVSRIHRELEELQRWRNGYVEGRIKEFDARLSGLYHNMSSIYRGKWPEFFQMVEKREPVPEPVPEAKGKEELVIKPYAVLYLDKTKRDCVKVVDKKLLHYLSMPIERCEFSIRVANTMENLKVKTVGQLAFMKTNDLLKIKNFGRKSIKEVKKVLADMDLHLDMELFIRKQPPPSPEAKLLNVIHSVKVRSVKKK